MYYRKIKSPIGELILAGDISPDKSETLKALGFPSGKGEIEPKASWQYDDNIFKEAEQQLAEYFNGDRLNFDLLLAPEGTAFQLKVLAALQTIPFGETKSYADIANQIGSPKAVRAVGSANGRNPLPIVIPCHRVIGSDGSLTGFGGGIDAKKFLLSLEGSFVENIQEDLF